MYLIIDVEGKVSLSFQEEEMLQWLRNNIEKAVYCFPRVNTMDVVNPVFFELSPGTQKEIYMNVEVIEG